MVPMGYNLNRTGKGQKQMPLSIELQKVISNLHWGGYQLKERGHFSKYFKSTIHHQEDSNSRKMVLITVKTGGASFMGT